MSGPHAPFELVELRGAIHETLVLRASGLPRLRRTDSRLKANPVSGVYRSSRAEEREGSAPLYPSSITIHAMFPIRSQDRSDILQSTIQCRYGVHLHMACKHTHPSRLRSSHIVHIIFQTKFELSGKALSFDTALLHIINNSYSGLPSSSLASQHPCHAQTQARAALDC